MTSKRIEILLVDDHTLVRDGLREVISHWEEFQVVGEAANGKEAVELCRQRQPDIVLMDIQMPVMNGVEAAQIILAETPATAVVMLTMSAEDQDIFEAVRHGARGYILKSTSSKQLREKLNDVAHGKVPLSGEIAAKILAEFTRLQPGESDPSVDSLTEREVHILRLIADGLSNEEIAAELFLSDHTVKKQLSNILQKLHLKNRAQAAAYAIRKGLAE